MLSPSLYLIHTADLPTTDNTTIATFADDTALLAIDSDPALASQKLQQHLDLLQEWFDKWKIKINQTKIFADNIHNKIHKLSTIYNQ
jgi:hypothetical protein